LKTGQQELI